MTGRHVADTGLTSRVATVTVDPRFRARRIAVRRDAGRRRLKRLLVLVALAAVALTSVVVLRSPVLDVDEIAVTGTAHVDAASVASATGIGTGEPLLLADLGAAASAVEALPWVAEARVTRELPGTVRVEVREREAAAVVTHGERTVLVDGEGRVLDQATAAHSDHVRVLAPATPPDPGGVVDRDLATAIELAGRLRSNPVGAVAVVHPSPLRLELAEGGTVELGDAVDLDAKVEAFRTVYARVDRTCLAGIDLTVPTHPVVTRQGCEA